MTRRPSRFTANPLLVWTISLRLDGRNSEKNQHCAVWDFTGTGPHMKVTVREGLPIADAGCSLCGQCITHCPTGALTARTDIHRESECLALT